MTIPHIPSHPLDIPDFLRRDKNEPRAVHTGPTISVRERKVKRPPGWYLLTKAEQDGTADRATIALRRELERTKKEKQAERFAKLKELAADRPKLPRPPKAPKASKQTRRSNRKQRR